MCSVLAATTVMVPLVASAQPIPSERLDALWRAGFIPNVGQFPTAVDYVYRGPGYTLVLADSAVTVLVGDSSDGARIGRRVPRQASRPLQVTLRVEGSRTVAPIGRLRRPGRNHHFLGRDARDWFVDLPYVGEVDYPDLLPGVDAIVTAGTDGVNLRFLKRGAGDVDGLSVIVEGAGAARPSPGGGVVFESGAGSIRLAAPKSIRGPGGDVVGRVEPNGSLDRDDAPRAAHDAQRLRVALSPRAGRVQGVDLGLHFPSSLGDGFAYAVATDASDALYVAGFTTALVTTPGVPQPGYGGGRRDAFVAKLGAGGQLIYASYLGGNAGDEGRAVAVDSGGNAYVAGFTGSTDFPISAALQPGFGGGTHDAFVTKLDPSGSRLLFSTFLGGSQPDFAEDLTVDRNGDLLVVGPTVSIDFPLVGSLQAPDGVADGFLAKLTGDGSSLLFSTVLGGSQCDAAWAVAADGHGIAYVTGQTNSPDFPVAHPIQGSFGGGVPACNDVFGGDAFVAAVDLAAHKLVFSTFLGGSSGDIGNGITADDSGVVLVAGRTDSADFPTVRPLQPSYAGGAGGSLLGGDAFVARIDTASATVVHSTFLGGAQGDAGYGVALDESGNAYVAGFTFSTNFPVQSAPQPFNRGGRDAFVAKLDPTGQQLLYSTYAGTGGNDGAFELAIDGARRAFYAGYSGGAASVGAVSLATLTVTRAGPGAGRVTGSLAGLDCGLDCIESYPTGSTITLVATADPGSRFVGWSGDPVCGQNVVMGTDISCVATFDAAMQSDAMGQLPTGEPYTLDGRTRVTRGPWPPAWDAHAADFNGDDQVDLLMYNHETGTWQQAINDGQGGFLTTTGTWSPGWDVLLLDLDGDSRPDVFVYSPVTGDWYRCSSGVAGGFTCSGRGRWSRGWKVHVVQYDGDAFDDLFLYNPVTGAWYWAINDGSTGFVYAGGSWSPGWSVLPGDMTGDGRTDLFLYNGDSGNWFVAVNAGPTFTYVPGRWSPGWSVLLMDLDDNGISDVLVYDPLTGAWYECVFDGSGGFTYVGGRWSPGWSLLPIDIDQDGRDDLFFYNPVTGDWFEGLNERIGSFTFTAGRWDPGLSLIVPTGG